MNSLLDILIALVIIALLYVVFVRKAKPRIKAYKQVREELLPYADKSTMILQRCANNIKEDRKVYASFLTTRVEQIAELSRTVEDLLDQGKEIEEYFGQCCQALTTCIWQAGVYLHVMQEMLPTHEQFAKNSQWYKTHVQNIYEDIKPGVTEQAFWNNSHNLEEAKLRLNAYTLLIRSLTENE